MPGRVDAALQRGGSRTQNRLVVVLGVVAIALAVAAFVGPWWVVNTSMSAPHWGGPMAGTVLFGLLGPAFTAPTDLQAKMENGCVNCPVAGFYGDTPNTDALFLVASALTALGILLGAGMVALAVTPRVPPKLRRWGSFLGLLASASVVAAALCVMAFLPGALTQDLGNFRYQFSGFWGSKSVFLILTVTNTWAAGWGWYVALAAVIPFFIGGILFLRTQLRLAKSGTAQAAQQV